MTVEKRVYYYLAAHNHKNLEPFGVSSRGMRDAIEITTFHKAAW